MIAVYCLVAFIFGLVCGYNIKPWWLAIIVATVGGYFVPTVFHFFGM